MIIPRKLSVSPLSPHYDKAACLAIKAVACDGVHYPDCVAYDLDAGWLIYKIDKVWQPRVYGKITVTLNN